MPVQTVWASKKARRPFGKREIRRYLRRPQATMRLQHGLLRAPRSRRISRFRPHESTAKLELSACPKSHSGLRTGLLLDICVAETRRGGTSPAFQLLDLEQNPSTSTGGASARKHFLGRLLSIELTLRWAKLAASYSFLPRSRKMELGVSRQRTPAPIRPASSNHDGACRHSPLAIERRVSWVGRAGWTTRSPAPFKPRRFRG